MHIANIELPMKRPLYTPPIKPLIADIELEAGDEEVDAAALYSQIVIDKAQLARHTGRANGGHHARHGELCPAREPRNACFHHRERGQLPRFSPVKDNLLVFGAGYGFEMLMQAGWLARCRIHYWGDIDTHGFAILDQLRSQFEHVESFLMDRATLLAFEGLWGEEEKPTRRDLPRLHPVETALYDDLRDNRIHNNLRLEQERIGFA